MSIAQNYKHIDIRTLMNKYNTCVQVAMAFIDSTASTTSGKKFVGKLYLRFNFLISLM